MYARRQCFGTTGMSDYREERTERQALSAVSPLAPNPIPRRPAVYRSGSGMTDDGVPGRRGHGDDRANAGLTAGSFRP